jgi:hypothetical protein
MEKTCVFATSRWKCAKYENLEEINENSASSDRDSNPSHPNNEVRLLTGIGQSWPIISKMTKNFLGQYFPIDSVFKYQLFPERRFPTSEIGPNEVRGAEKCA